MATAAAAAAILSPIEIKKSGFSANFTKPSCRKVVIKMMMSSNSSDNRKVQIRLPSTCNKVFEDPSKGIVCYRDENGEITCEGIDEGPRFCHPPPHPPPLFAWNNQRDAEIIDLLRRGSIQMIEDLRFIN